MAEVFKPRENMTCIGLSILSSYGSVWQCCDSLGRHNCDGGPSVIWGNGDRWLFQVGGTGLHRLDGPATSEGQWWIRGKNVTQEILVFAKENNIDLENLTDEDKVLIALKFG